MGDTIIVTQEIFVVEFEQESKFMFHHARITIMYHMNSGEQLFLDRDHYRPIPKRHGRVRLTSPKI